MLQLSNRNFSELGFLFFFFLATLFLYRDTVDAGFVMDFTGWALTYEKGSFADILTCFGYPGLHQIQHLVFYSMYVLFDTWGIPWFLIFCTLHALNAWLLFKLFNRFFTWVSIKNGLQISMLGALLFVVIPYQAEVVIWRVCSHYLLCTLLILLSLYATINYIEKGSNWSVFWAHIFFVISLFALEITLIAPALLLVFIIALYLCKPEFSIKKLIGRIVVPQFFLIAGYLLLNKFVLGAWVGHYGAETHLQFSLQSIITTALQYLIKYLAFITYLPYSSKHMIYDFFTGTLVAYSFFGLGTLLLALVLFYAKKISKGVKISVMLLVMFFISLLPILNLYFMYILVGENDRYGYLASMFLCMFIVFLFFQIPGKLKYGVYLVYFGISVFLLNKTTGYWNQATKVCYGLIEDFRWYDKDEVVILTSADNYSGIYLFRCIGTCSGFHEALEVLSDNKYAGKMTEIVQFNMMSPHDSVNVKVDSNMIDITFAQEGNWFWDNGIGARSYENDEYKFSIYEYSSVLEIKKKNPNRVFIYQAGDHWTEVKI